MGRLTAQMFHEVLQSVEKDIEILEMDESMADDGEPPTQAERAAIERVEKTLEKTAAAVREELDQLK